MPMLLKSANAVGLSIALLLLMAIGGVRNEDLSIYLDRGGVEANTAKLTTESIRRCASSASKAMALRFTDRSNTIGRAAVAKRFKVAPFRRYELRTAVFAAAPTQITVALRNNRPHYQTFGIRRMSLRPGCTEVRLQGISPFRAPTTGSGRILLPDGGDIALHGMDIVELEEPLIQRAEGSKIRLGMVFNRLGVHQNWPPMPITAIRLWDTGTTWADIEPQERHFQFRRLDLYRDFARAHSADIILTLGQTPAWAARSADRKCTYARGCMPSQSLSSWRNYVRALASRYGRDVAYWEVWNEPDYSGFWAGSAGQLVDLTRIARDEIRRINPDAKIVGPAVTGIGGLEFLDEFLMAGGGKLIDIVSYHSYYSSLENAFAVTWNIKRVLKARGLENIPVWNTESSPRCDYLTISCTGGLNDTDHYHALKIYSSFNIGMLVYYNYETKAEGAAISLPPNYEEINDSGVALTQAVDRVQSDHISATTLAAGRVRVEK